MKGRSTIFGSVLLAGAVAWGLVSWLPSLTTQSAAAPASLSSSLSEIAAGASAPAAAPLSFSEIAAQASPAVVNVATSQKARKRGGGPESPFPGPFGEDDPFSEFFRRFGPPQPREAPPARSLGSGFIIDPDGIIVTNHHVVADAEKIVVRVASNGTEYEAKLLGSDPKTDLAVLEIEPTGPLPHLQLGDSDRLRVGDWVVAIGNPFGLEQTVTAGIVSARKRVIGQGPYDDFIQTDASINPGNSGGPLLNLEGEVVGINSAIFSRSGGNMGIGFAIPAALARPIVEQLRDTGKVVRGWLGVVIQDVNAELAESFGLDEATGALVSDLRDDGPAALAGIERGDVIVSWNGKPVESSRDLPALVAETAPGQKVKIEVVRGGKNRSFRVEVAEMPAEIAGVEESGESEETAGKLGLAVAPVTPQVARRLELPESRGVLVRSVQPGSPAEGAGIRAGDVILEVDRKAVDSVAAFREAVGKKGKDTLLLLVRRGESTVFLALRK